MAAEKAQRLINLSCANTQQHTSDARNKTGDKLPILASNSLMASIEGNCPLKEWKFCLDRSIGVKQHLSGIDFGLSVL